MASHNPYVFAGDPAQVGEGGVMVLQEVDSAGRREEEPRVGLGSGSEVLRPGMGVGRGGTGQGSEPRTSTGADVGRPPLA